MSLAQTDIEDDAYLGRQLQQHSPAGAIVVQNKLFAVALSRAASIAGRADIPIVACVLLRSNGHALTIEANNMELAIRQTIAVSGGSAEGCVNAAMFNAVMQRLPGDAETTIEFRAGRMAWKCGGARGTLEALPAVDFPTFSEGPFSCRFSMDAAGLLAAFERTMPFVSTNIARSYLMGVNLHRHPIEGEHYLVADATDMQRMARVRMACPSGAETIPNIIIPARSIVEFTKALKEDGNVEIAASDHAIMIKTNDLTITSKLIDGVFPEIDRGIPRENTSRLRVDAAAFLGALALCETTTTGLCVVKLSLSIEAVGISAKSGDNEVNTQLTSGDFEYEGDNVTIGFNIRFLADTVKLMKETAIFQFRDAETQYLAWDEADPSAIYVASPLRV